MSDELSYLENDDGEFAVPCQLKIAEDCVQQGEFCEDKKKPVNGSRMSAGYLLEKVIFAFNAMNRFCAILQTLPPKK